MDRDDLRMHREQHTRDNSWWEHDARGIPLCRVCAECIDDSLAGYRPEVLGTCGKYEDAVEEQIEEDE